MNFYELYNKIVSEYTDKQKQSLLSRKDSELVSQGPDYQGQTGTPPYPTPLMKKKMKK